MSSDLPAGIILYEERYKEDFRSLNLEWLEKYNLAESHDLEILDDPRSTILDHGGFIWLAVADERVVGSAALIKVTNDEYELAKMAVAADYRGRGISKLLIQTCISQAKKIGAKKMTLFSNHQLLTALKLYEKYGFYYVDVEDSPFETADVKMEMIL